jgi:hypothetical protein
LPDPRIKSHGSACRARIQSATSSRSDQRTSIFLSQFESRSLFPYGVQVRLGAEE